MLAGNQAGIFHAGGPRTLSLYQIAQIINRVGGYDPDCLLGIPRGEAGPIPPRAGNVSMDSGKLIRTLGYDPLDPWPLDESLVPTYREWHRERGPGEHGSPRRLQELLCRNPARRRPCSWFTVNWNCRERPPWRSGCSGTGQSPFPTEFGARVEDRQFALAAVRAIC